MFFNVQQNQKNREVDIYLILITQPENKIIRKEHNEKIFKLLSV